MVRYITLPMKEGPQAEIVFVVIQTEEGVILLGVLFEKNERMKRMTDRQTE